MMHYHGSCLWKPTARIGRGMGIKMSLRLELDGILFKTTFCQSQEGMATSRNSSMYGGNDPVTYNGIAIKYS